MRTERAGAASRRRRRGRPLDGIRGRGVGAVAAVLLATVAAGCLPSSDVLASREWRLLRAAGARPAAPGSIQFGTDGRFALATGCNTGGGSYRLEGDRIRFADLVLTEIACEGAVGAQESAVIAVLAGTPRYEIGTRTGVLTLTAPDGSGLAFDGP